MIVVDSLVWIDFFNGVNTPEEERINRLLGATWPPPADCSVRCHCCRCGLGIKAAPFLLAPANDGLRLTTTPLRGELTPNKGSRKRDDRGEWLMPMLLPKGFGLVRCDQLDPLQAPEGISHLGKH